MLWLDEDLIGSRREASVSLPCVSDANPLPTHYWTINGTRITNGNLLLILQNKLYIYSYIKITYTLALIE